MSGDSGLPFTVNNIMLSKEGMTFDGFAYILFAPVDVAQNLAENQSQMQSTKPPIVALPNLNNTMAYVLPAPTGAFIFRYKAPNSSWPGSPDNAPCAMTSAEAVPVGCTLNGWSPAILRENSSSLAELVASVLP